MVCIVSHLSSSFSLYFLYLTVFRVLIVFSGSEEREGSSTLVQARQVRRWQTEEEGSTHKTLIYSLNFHFIVSSLCFCLFLGQTGDEKSSQSLAHDVGLCLWWILWEQKWSKGKQKEKVNNMVLFDQAAYDKLLSEAPKYKLITPSILSDRLRVFFSFLFILHAPFKRRSCIILWLKNLIHCLSCAS